MVDRLRGDRAEGAGALHENHGRRVAERAEGERVFGLTVAAALTVLALLPLRQGRAPHLAALAAAAVLIVAALARPRVLRPLQRVWHALGRLSGALTTPVILLLLFLVVVTPLALLRRLMGRDPLRRRRNAAARSYWLPRTRDDSVESLTVQY